MKYKQKERLTYLSLCFLGALGFGIFIFSALEENLMYFVNPTDLQKEYGTQQTSPLIRLGGVVEKQSVRKDPKTLLIYFKVTDFKTSIPVQYKGITPDLFKEGQGVIAEGYWKENMFIAHKILAKHDENYTPPTIRKKL